MRVLVCGGRDFTNYELMKETLNALDVTELIHGAARGADTCAERFGREQGIPVHSFPAQWSKHGRSAGAIRNIQMVVEGKPGLVVAFPTPRSRGTRHAIETARKYGIECIVVTDQKTMNG